MSSEAAPHTVVAFEERQYFRQPWLPGVLAIVIAALGVPHGRRPT